MPSVPQLKAFLQKIPFPVGALIAQVPYSCRPGYGRLYRLRRRQIRRFIAMPEPQQRRFVFERVRRIVEHAWDHVDFYRSLYEQQGFHPSRLRSFEDISEVPVVTKSMLQEWDLETRSFKAKGRYLVNTGGSSGSTLAFYILPSAVAHEWAHVHHAWARLGYRQSDLKLGFAGWWDMGTQPFQYDGLRHQFAINIFADPAHLAESLKPVLRRHKVLYLHGYPSAIYDFARHCDQADKELRDMLRGMLRAVFLSSEYPAPPYREMIESTFGVPTSVFYGHTERAILATEVDQPYVFHPLHTYGFAEAVADPGTGICKLVGTAYYNTASPLIRYDTSDEIRVECMTGGLLNAFRIEAGREGDYILGRTGKRIPLTGLIFGRHHPIFNRAAFIQIAQDAPGHATVCVTLRKSGPAPEVLDREFDAAGVDVSFSYRILEKPIVTSRGKVLLKVPPQALECLPGPKAVPCPR